MKKRQITKLPPSLAFALAALFAAVDAQASLNTVNESQSSTLNVWPLPSGTNLLATAAIAPASPATHEGSSPIWTTLTNGQLGIAADKSASVTPTDGDSVVFTLNTSTNTAGYSLSSIDTYAAWPDSGRDNQNFTIEYATVTSPGIFLPLATVNNATGDPVNNTHTRLTDTTGTLATNVGEIRFNFAGQENTWVGLREFIVLGTPVPLNPPLTWSGAGGSGGSATWISGADSNWKLSSNGSPANYNVSSPLTFDNTGINRNITVAAGGLQAFSMRFTNDAATPYVIGGGTVTTLNDLAVVGTGSVTLTGVNNVSGLVTVSSGTLSVANNTALSTGNILLTGGAVNFTTAAPQISSLAGTGGSVVLGSSSGPVNTVLTVAGNNSTSFTGSITDASGASGGLTKGGSGTLTLGGVNSYSGTTRVTGGSLSFAIPDALYSANESLWTAANIVVEAGSTLGFGVGGDANFDASRIETLSGLGTAAGGFMSGSFIGLDSSAGDFTVNEPIDNPNGGANTLGVTKLGDNNLYFNASNTYTGPTIVGNGALLASNPDGVSVNGDLILGGQGNGLNFTTAAPGQFGNTVLSFINGSQDAKFQMRGNSFTLKGLDSADTNTLSIIQNDEPGTPGYSGVPSEVTLTLDTDTDHSFYGIIRNADGVLGLTKTGPGTQELRNSTFAVGIAYSGPTLIEEGKLVLNLAGANNGFNSDITVNGGALLAVDGAFNLGRKISGTGSVVKEGEGTVGFITNNEYSGGTAVNAGMLILNSGGQAGEGTVPGLFSNIGLMDPSNVLTINDGGIVRLDFIAPLGGSTTLPEFAPSVLVNEGGTLFGNDSVSFVPNLTLNGGTVEIGNGNNYGGFNTNLGLIGPVKVTGTTPSDILTVGTGANANVSLGGSAATAGGTFEVANVTGNGDVDLTVAAILRNVQGIASPLTKDGPGTMSLSAANTYTGTTTVEEGELVLGVPSLADSADLVIAAGAVINLAHGQEDRVKSLYFGDTQADAGVYVAPGSSTPGTPNPSLKGNGSIRVGIGPAVTFGQWALVIPNAGDRDRTDDPDKDGLTNLDEFLFGTSPIAGSGSLITSSTSGTNLIVRWNQLPEGGNYTLQENTNLSDPWISSPITPAPDPDQAGAPAGYIRFVAAIPVAGPRKFVRVEGIEP